MTFRALTPAEFEWITRPHEPEEPARHGTPPEDEHAELLESAV